MLFHHWQIEIGEPAVAGRLQVFPLYCPDLVPVDYELSADAVRARTVVVSEISAAGCVPELRVRNEGKRRVLFVEGEQLIGAKQNRVLNTSVLVPAMSELTLPVSCVEHGRWQRSSPHFECSPFGSSSKVRSTLKRSVTESVQRSQGHRSDQTRIWSDIAMQQVSLGLHSLSAAMEDSYVAHGDYLQEVRGQLPYVEGAQGVLVETVGEMLVWDLFDRAETCRRVWDRLVWAAAIDELAPVQAKPKPWHMQEILRGRLDRLKDLAWSPAKPVGEGEELRAVGDGSAASLLLLGGMLVHGSAVIS